MLPYVVMPCLDEVELIEGVIASLGFTASDAPPDAHFNAAGLRRQCSREFPALNRQSWIGRRRD